MASITVRNLSPRLLLSLKRLARNNRRSMEQEARRILEEQVSDRLAVVAEIRASWERQRRATSPREVARWVRASRT